MSSHISDIECMVLERIKFDSLTHVSKVKRQWRKYISEHIRRMSSFPCESITIEYPIRRIRVNKNLEPMLGTFLSLFEAVPKVSPSVDSIVKYRTATFEFRESSLSQTQTNDERYQIYAEVISLPRWWYGSITEVHLTLRENFPPANFVSYFSSIKELYIKVCNQETADSYLHEFIMAIPKVNKLKILGGGIVLGDSILETIMKKSWTHPMEFPTLSANQNFSLQQIIRFIESAKICPSQREGEDIHTIPYYYWYLSSPVKGKRKDWKNWIKQNAKFVFKSTRLRSGRLADPPLEYFTYRESSYNVFIPDFID